MTPLLHFKKDVFPFLSLVNAISCDLSSISLQINFQRHPFPHLLAMFPPQSLVSSRNLSHKILQRESATPSKISNLSPSKNNSTVAFSRPFLSICIKGIPQCCQATRFSVELGESSERWVVQKGLAMGHALKPQPWCPVTITETELNPSEAIKRIRGRVASSHLQDNCFADFNIPGEN